MDIITRKEAKAHGLKTFFTGEPCKRGHVAERYVRKGDCVTCQAEANRLWREANKARRAEYSRCYREANKERHAETNRLWREANKERKAETNRIWHENNRERQAEYTSLWTMNNRPKVNAYSAKRRATKIQATPAWLTSEDLKAIEGTYELAALHTELFGEAYHVDHIIPLQGKYVCGLHVPGNLQVISATENLCKNNSFDLGEGSGSRTPPVNT